MPCSLLVVIITYFHMTTKNVLKHVCTCLNSNAYSCIVMCSLEEREKVLELERKSKMKEWSVKLESLQGMLQEQENAFKQREGIAADLETVKFKKSEIEVKLSLFL